MKLQTSSSPASGIQLQKSDLKYLFDFATTIDVDSTIRKPKSKIVGSLKPAVAIKSMRKSDAGSHALHKALHANSPVLHKQKPSFAFIQPKPLISNARYAELKMMGDKLTCNNTEEFKICLTQKVVRRLSSFSNHQAKKQGGTDQSTKAAVADDRPTNQNDSPPQIAKDRPSIGSTSINIERRAIREPRVILDDSLLECPDDLLPSKKMRSKSCFKTSSFRDLNSRSRSKISDESTHSTGLTHSQRKPLMVRTPLLGLTST